MTNGYYTTNDLAKSLGVSPQNVRSKLRKKFPRQDNAWWRFTRAEYETLLTEFAGVAKPKRRLGA